LYDYTVAFSVPLISGKDSMKNDYVHGTTKISIPPTLLFTAIGKIEDVRKAVTMDVKAAGDLVYVLGMTRSELGGSEFYAISGEVGVHVPVVNADEALSLYKRLGKAMKKGLVRSCHDLSDGGLGVALAESAFAGGFGMVIDLKKVPVEGVKQTYEALFSESASRFVVTIDPKNKEKFEKALEGIVFAEIGNVAAVDMFKIIGLDNSMVVDSNLSELKEAWQKPLAW